MSRRCHHAVPSRCVCSYSEAAGQSARENRWDDGKLAGGAVRLSCIGRALRNVGRLPVPHGDCDLSSRQQRPAQSRHDLCHRLTGRLLGRNGAKRLPYPRLRILEDCMAVRGREPCARSIGRTSLQRIPPVSVTINAYQALTFCAHQRQPL